MAQNQSRVAKVLAALLISMTTGAVLLMSLGSNPPSAGAFCLSSYYRLCPIDKAISAKTTLEQGRWNQIEVYYSQTKAGNLEQLASLNGLAKPEDLNCHFVMCNGLGGGDGQILSTEKWQKQWSCVPARGWYGNAKTIRICVIGDFKANKATNCQRKRTEALVEMLYRQFNVQPENISYPADWQ